MSDSVPRDKNFDNKTLWILLYFSPRGDFKRSYFDQLHAHILERQKIASALRCVRSADQNMAANNRPLDFLNKPVRSTVVNR